MSERIHIVVDEAEKERFRRRAEREGKSLSAWLREAARERLAADRGPELDTVGELDAFFADCDEREEGREPDWDAHRRTSERSVGRGAADG